MAALDSSGYTDCEPRATPLSFDGGYIVRMCYEVSDGTIGEAKSGTWASGQSGLLWFFNRDNAEVLIKVLDGCSINDHRWVYVAPVTDLAFNLVVIRISDGQRWFHRNKSGHTAATSSDTAAFRCSSAGSREVGRWSLIPGSNEPRGIAYAHGRFYVADERTDEKAYAYGNNGLRVPSADFYLDRGSPAGITYAEHGFYVVDKWLDKVYGYWGRGSRMLWSTDFYLNNGSSAGITYANDHLYIVDEWSDRVYAYARNGARMDSADFDLDPENGSPAGITYAHGRFYVVDQFHDKVYAYDNGGRRVPSADFDLDQANIRPTGITYALGRFYVVDAAAELFAYWPPRSQVGSRSD